jgi:hypothetical protein
MVFVRVILVVAELQTLKKRSECHAHGLHLYNSAKRHPVGGVWKSAHHSLSWSEAIFEQIKTQRNFISTLLLLYLSLAWFGLKWPLT